MVDTVDAIVDENHGKGICAVEVTVDVGVYTKALEVILAEKEKDSRMNRSVLRQNMFHTAMCYQVCIGRLYGSAGLRDLLIEDDILTEGLCTEYRSRGVQMAPVHGIHIPTRI